MKALGVHTYLGGFELGVRNVATETLGSIEIWKPGILARQACKKCGVSQPLSFGDVSSADLVFSNPPCSRFSSAASYHYDDNDKSKLTNFEDLMHGVDVTEQVGAKAFWWETGPHCWSRGMGMVENVHRVLRDGPWGGEATTVVIRYDPRWSGVPQRRPRTHVVHMAGRLVPPANIESSLWPIDETLGPWVERFIREHDYDPADMIAVSPRECDGRPNYTAKWMRDVSSFSQGAPRTLSIHDAFSVAVLSGRICCWEEKNEGKGAWWTIEEYSALMTIPPQIGRAMFDGAPGRWGALSLLSKGIAPVAAEYVYRNVVEPMVADGREAPCSAFEAHDAEIWKLDCNVKDGRRKRSA